MKDPLKGYKTLIAAGVYVGVGVYLNVTGQIDAMKLVEMLAAAGMFLGVADKIRRQGA